jgi:hypothetical protein
MSKNQVLKFHIAMETAKFIQRTTEPQERKKITFNSECSLSIDDASQDGKDNAEICWASVWNILITSM